MAEKPVIETELAQEFGTYDAVQASEEVSLGDEVLLKFTNSYDKRYSSPVEWEWEVTYFDREPTKSGGIIVLNVKKENGDKVRLTSNKEVSVQKEGDRSGNAVGTYKDSEFL